ncbi:hypothetical protein LOTGIDRAFT_163159 [Lottia gigantea]|uniref:Uncharacterized protein n=1 Tax=Lottia gigantea TaxID=225164 RepID=V4BSA0_LOTGI|nr:hypothetical protein LOTGIDRAFT_163159 [Lottia gigantea]ESO91799.1 hypothetical protein LOTGIDRAFT_163159 [Lottia gigantea]
MKHASLSQVQQSKVRRHLLVGNVFLEEVRESKQSISYTKRNILHRLAAGKIAKKYRCIRSLSRLTGLSRNHLGRVNSKSVISNNFHRLREVRIFKQKVIEFMERDDNSRTMPGKSDFTKINHHTKVTTRVLTDYLSNLHQKYLSENHEVKLSLASFSRIRPKHIRKTAFISRSTCLCTRHQNMALFLKAIQRSGASVPSNPESFLREVTDLRQITESITEEEITFGQWKRVPFEEKGKTKMVMKIVEEKVIKAEFVSKLTSQFEDFKAHVSWMKRQYSEIQSLKEHLPKNDVIIHMDFAENYNCKSVEEIQSAYWNQTSVTLHPVVNLLRIGRKGS